MPERRYYDPPDDVGCTVFDPTDETFGPIMAALQAGELEEAAKLTRQLAERVERVGPSPRLVLAHLNIEVPDGDKRTAGEVGEAVMAAVSVGSDDDSVEGLKIVLALAEDV